MSRNTDRFEIAVETFMNTSDLTEAEAEVFVHRQLDGRGRAETAQLLDKDASTVDSLQQRYKQKEISLPSISKINTHERVGFNEDSAVVVYFENGAQLRYRADSDEGTVYEETIRADDPDSVYESMDVGIEATDMREAALESIAEYINVYQNDVDACVDDWPHVYESLTGYRSGQWQ